jgi:uncharacterized cupredoxin-like copper-binding protein
MSLATSHVATLCRYAGISFIAGAVNHGFFSGERSLATAALGVVAYLVGAVLERRARPDEAQRWVDLLGVGIVSSIGLGFFTGGLQHFPDSPARSAWVVPLGFAMSAAAFWLLQRHEAGRPRAFLAYALVAGLLVSGASVLAWRLYETGVLEAAPHAHAPTASGAAAGHDDGHDHGGGGHDHGTPAAGSSGTVPREAPAAASASAAPGASVRGAVPEVLVEMDDGMRFSPADIEVTAGVPVRLVVVNRGRLVHELVIGTERELAEHAREMKSGAPHHHGDGAVRVAPGGRVEVMRTFAEPGRLGIACFEPGHFEAGMKGTLTVRPRP